MLAYYKQSITPIRATFNPYLWALIVVASNAPVYTGAARWWPKAPKPPVHRRSSARCSSRRWRLPTCPYWAGKERPAGRPWSSARLPKAVPPPAYGWCVSALFERADKENGVPRPSQAIPERPHFGSLLLVDHHLSSLCHSATNEPSANVYLGGETTLYTIYFKRRF